MSLAFNYQVPYIQQQRQMSCWLTAMQMIDHWLFIQEMGQACVDPDWVNVSVKICEAFQLSGRATKSMRPQLLNSAPLASEPDGKNYPNRGVTRQEMIDFGMASGLTVIEWENMAGTLNELYGLLKTYGPLLSAGVFMNGQPHAIVITGVLEARLPYPDYDLDSADEWVIYSDPILGPGSRISFEDFKCCYSLLGEPGIMMGKK